MEEAEAKDKKEEEEIEEYLKSVKVKGDFMRVMALNEPLFLIIIACIGAAIAGFSQPYMGVIFSKVMNLLTVPTQFWAAMKGPNYLQDELNFWVL
jgi:hypothetical protein